MELISKIRGLIKNLKLSREIILWGIVGIGAAILVFALGIPRLIDLVRNADEDIVLKRKFLLKYNESLKSRDSVKEALDKSLRQYEMVQQKLISGETAQIGTANLQEIVKRFSEKNGINIRSFRMLEPKEVGGYKKVFLYIEFNPISSMLSLSQFIYDIEHHEKGLMIPEMELIAINPRMPNSLQGNMVISGIMKPGLDKEKGRER